MTEEETQGSPRGLHSAYGENLSRLTRGSFSGSGPHGLSNMHREPPCSEHQARQVHRSNSLLFPNWPTRFRFSTLNSRNRIAKHFVDRIDFSESENFGKTAVTLDTLYHYICPTQGISVPREANSKPQVAPSGRCSYIGIRCTFAVHRAFGTYNLSKFGIKRARTGVV